MLGVLTGTALGVRAPDELLWFTLLGLIFVTGFSISLDFSKVLSTVRSNIWNLIIPFTTVAGSLTGGLVAHFLTGFSLRYSLAISAGMGWYSFTGTYLGGIDLYAGFLGYVANVLREVYTYLTYPILARRWRYSSVSIGGATTMDTTLPLITSAGGTEVGVMAFIHGALLTFLIPILIPLIVSLPG
ncbi:MAG: lysine exporter LysO family protein [Zestosphaera sp.]